jgi:hypothetical protein
MTNVIFGLDLQESVRDFINMNLKSEEYYRSAAHYELWTEYGGMAEDLEEVCLDNFRYCFDTYRVASSVIEEMIFGGRAENGAA